MDKTKQVADLSLKVQKQVGQLNKSGGFSIHNTDAVTETLATILALSFPEERHKAMKDGSVEVTLLVNDFSDALVGTKSPFFLHQANDGAWELRQEVKLVACSYLKDTVGLSTDILHGAVDQLSGVADMPVMRLMQARKSAQIACAKAPQFCSIAM